MKLTITVECPEVICGRCQAKAMTVPRLVKQTTLRQPVWIGSRGGNEIGDMSATDSHGGAWSVLEAVQPEGWGASVNGKPLCPRCAAAWRELDDAFLRGKLPNALPLPLNRKLPPVLDPPVPQAVPGVQRTVPTEQKTRVDHHAAPDTNAKVAPAPQTPVAQKVVTAMPAPAAPEPPQRHAVSVPPAQVRRN